MDELTCEEAGLALMWIGQVMAEQDVIALVALDFNNNPNLKDGLFAHLIENDVDVDRATEIVSDITIDGLISCELLA